MASTEAMLRPVALLDAEFADARRGDQAAVDELDLVRAVPAQPGPPLASTVYWTRVRQAGHLARGQLVALGGHHGAVPAGLLGSEAGQALAAARRSPRP